MWDGFSMLFILSTLMAVASFLAGSLPLSLSLSQRQLRLISALGAGVLVGTALIVIIPEGIDTLYSAGESSHDHHKRAPSGHQFARDGHKEKNHGHDPHAWVGICLVLGFILLYLVDVVPTISKKGAYKPLHISLSNLDRGLHHSPSSTVHSPRPVNEEQPQERSSATTIGLIIHAVADGIALGASSSTTSSSLSLIIFIAIMLHKAPAAFGLTSILLKQGLSTRQARGHLLVFSLAAPAGAFATWIAVNMIGRKRLGGEEGLAWATGCMLLFSGGTFLYVAMHSMQHITPDPHAHAHAHDEQVPSAGPWTDAEAQANAQKTTGTTRMEIAIVVVGMLLPFLSQFGHAH